MRWIWIFKLTLPCTTHNPLHLVRTGTGTVQLYTTGSMQYRYSTVRVQYRYVVLLKLYGYLTSRISTAMVIVPVQVRYTTTGTGIIQVYTIRRTQ